MVKNGVNGLICEKQNSEALATALSRLMEDKALQKQMGEAGYKLFKERFTLQRFEARMCEVLKESRFFVTLHL